MKRALVVLLALVMGAGLLFAADPAPTKWGAYLEGYFTFWNQDGAGRPCGRPYRNSFTLSLPTPRPISVSARLRSTSRPVGGTLAPQHVHGLVQAVRRHADYRGQGPDPRLSRRPATTTAATAYTRLANAEWGAVFQVIPVKGLSVGVFVKFPSGLQLLSTTPTSGFGASYAIRRHRHVYSEVQTSPTPS